jgi:hypothetical protein
MSHTAPAPAASVGPVRLSAELRALAARFSGQHVRLADVFAVTQGRGYYVLMILCCLPFLTPIPTPMLSSVFGGVIFLTALRLALGQRPRLPLRLLQKPLPPGLLLRLVRAAARLLNWLETLLRPRLGFMHGSPIIDRIGAGVIAVSALLLMLPVPVPFSNFFPAAAILLLSAGALERDGLCSLAGWTMCLVAAAFMGIIAFGGATALDRITEWFIVGT